jgi:dihydrofolate reductase
MMLCLLVAAARNGVIGDGQRMPWHLPADLRYFRQLTTGHVVLMGRKTYDSIGKALPNRSNIVITRNPHWWAEGAQRAGSLEEALQQAAELLTRKGQEPGQPQGDPSPTGQTRPADTPVFVIGGGEIYHQALPLADRIYLTRVETEAEGSVFFPDPGPEWTLVSRDCHGADERHAYAYCFEVYERASGLQDYPGGTR